MPVPEAREILLKRVEEESRNEMNRVVNRIEEEMRDEAENRARKVLTMAIQRCAVDQTARALSPLCRLPSDEMKAASSVAKDATSAPSSSFRVRPRHRRHSRSCCRFLL
jgi:hypothetical protein